MIDYRHATSDDADSIAALHADSWRRHYRGAYLDSYLDGDVVADRQAVWREQLGRTDPGHCTVVADDGGDVVGFAHVVLDNHPRWGALLENLHVRHDVKGRGVGTRLMAEVARWVVDQRPSSGLYLGVLEQNTPAQAFYRARGGECVERVIDGPFPGGGFAPALTMAWPDPAELGCEKRAMQRANNQE